MRKKLTKGLIVLALLLGLLAFVRTCTLSGNTQNQLQSLLQAAGFESVILPAPEKKGGALIFTNISLDPDSFSTIGQITIRPGVFYGWREIEFTRIELTGEFNDGAVSIAGWQKRKIDFKKLGLRAMPVIIFNEARLSLLNPKIGGINLKWDLQLRPNTHGYEFQSKLVGAQSQLSYSAKANGSITGEGFWQAVVDVEQAKFALGLIKGTRISGKIDLSGHALEDSQILGELQAGGFSILNLPWENASLTLDGSLSQTRLVTSAQSTAIEGIEFSLILESLQNPDQFSGTVHTESLGALFDYLDSRKALFFERKALAPLDHLRELDAEFSGASNLFTFSVYGKNTPLIEKGSIKPLDEGLSLQELGAGLPFELALTTEKGTLKGQIARSQDGLSLVTLPEGKKIRPKLDKNSKLIDIFR